MTSTTKLTIPGRTFLLGSLLVFALSFPLGAKADVTCCVFQNNGGPCVNICYVTDLTCADITIGFLIQSCTDMIAGGGGSGGGVGVLEEIHELFDGQVNIGDGPFPGAVDLPSTMLESFVFTRPVVAHDNLDQSIQVLGFDAIGNIYRADVPTAGLDRFASGDLVIQATLGGAEIPNPLDGNMSGRMAISDVTLSVSTIDRVDNTTVLDTQDTPVGFSNLVWSYVGEGAVATDQLTWDSLKAGYLNN